MSTALKISSKCLASLAQLGQWFKTSIRSKILQVIERHIDDLETEMMEKVV